MKATELIAKLQALVKEHGDKQVKVELWNWGDNAELIFMVGEKLTPFTGEPTEYKVVLEVRNE